MVGGWKAGGGATVVTSEAGHGENIFFESIILLLSLMCFGSGKGKLV